MNATPAGCCSVCVCVCVCVVCLLDVLVDGWMALGIRRVVGTREGGHRGRRDREVVDL